MNKIRPIRLRGPICSHLRQKRFITPIHNNHTPVHTSIHIKHFANSTKKTHTPKLQSLRGCHDYFPEQCHKFTAIEQIFIQTAQKYCYDEIRTPILEQSALINRSIGTTSDIVHKELYEFIDRGSTAVVLRPEATASVCRAVIQRGVMQNSTTERYYYCGPMFRHERPQSGRLRQFTQFGIECINSSNNSSDVYNDIECIVLAYNCIQRLEIDKICKLHINSLGDIESRQQYTIRLTEYLKHRYILLSEDSQLRYNKNTILRILDSKAEIDQRILSNKLTEPELQQCIQYMKQQQYVVNETDARQLLQQKSPILINTMNEASKKRFNFILSTLDEFGIPYTVDHSLVRGLDYYTHTIFEYVYDNSAIVDNKQANTLQNNVAVLAGGRYDNLYLQLGGPDIPAIGWAAGIERIALIRDILNVPSIATDSSIAVVTQSSDEAQFSNHTILSDTDRQLQLYAQQLTFTLRNNNLAVLPLQYTTLSKQLKYAHKHNALAAVLIGVDELQTNTFRVRDLRTSEQTVISNDALSDYLHQLHDIDK